MVIPRPPSPAAKRPVVRSAAAPTLLLTGFEPFGGDPVNPSWLLAKALHGRQIAGHRVVALCLPTVFGDAARQLRAQVLTQRPALVLCLGLAGGRTALSLERVAINVDDARMADNARCQPVDRAIVAGAPAAYFAQLPIKAMVLAMRKAGVAAEVSNTAGTFVCNHVFYALMHLIATGRGTRRIRGGFMHVPWLPDQARLNGSTHGLPLQDMVHGLRAALHAALVHRGADLPLPAGAIH